MLVVITYRIILIRIIIKYYYLIWSWDYYHRDGICEGAVHVKEILSEYVFLFLFLYHVLYL